MSTIEMTATVLGDESFVSSDISRTVVWALAAENIAAGKVVRLKQAATGATVEIYDYVGTPDQSLPPYGIALTTVSAGSSIPIVIAGMVPSSITGLLTGVATDPATVDSSGNPVRNASFAITDWVIGVVDEQGRLQLGSPHLGIVYTATDANPVGTGSPEGVVVGNVGDVYHRTDGGAGTSVYAKEAGTGLNTGWKPITTSSDIGAANTVWRTNAAGTAREWAKITNSNVDAAAAIVVTKLAFGAADDVVKTNAGATALEHGKIANANIASNAAIAITKLAGGTKHRETLSWSEDGDLWKIDAGECRSIYTWKPATGATAGSLDGWGQTATGTVTHPALASTNLQTQSRRTQFESAPGANEIAGITTDECAWRGSGGLGGFFFWARYSMATNTASTRAFIGLAPAASVADCTANPSTATNIIGVGYDTGDSNWYIMRTDSVRNLTKVDTGVAKSTTDMFELRMFCGPSASAIFVQLYDFQTGTLLINTSYSTNIPDAAAFLCAFAHCGAAASGVAQKIQLFGVRVESYL